MPFTDEFLKVRRRLRDQYPDIAKADSFAYETAFELGIKTFRDKERKFKRQGLNIND